jgi:branched-chain amino acid transport system substrate-binding protein
MNQAREIGIEAPFQLVLIGPTAAFFAGMFGDNLDGIVTAGHWAPGQSKWAKAQPFFDAYKAKFNEAPDYLDSVLAYMSLEILQAAVAEAGLDRDKIREVISSSTFETINGPVRFEGVQNVETPTMLLQFQDGEGQIIWPKSHATADFQPKQGWAP